MDQSTLKAELGRIRGAIMSGSFDRDTALDALDKAEAACDQLKAPPSDTSAKSHESKPLSSAFTPSAKPPESPVAAAPKK